MKEEDNNKQQCLIAPRLVIIDGAHLCLLPPQSICDSIIDRKRPRPSANDIDCQNGQDSHCISIPALPLALVGDVFINDYSTSLLEDDGDDDASMSENGSNNNDRHATKNNEPLMGDLLSCMEMIHLNPSDLSNAEYRFIPSASLMNGTSSLPMRIFSVDFGMGEGSITMSNDGQAVEVCLPSFMSDCESHEHDEAGQVIYGDGWGDILGEDNDRLGKEVGHDDDQPSIEIYGAGSCLVSDIMGIAGYQQALICPRVDEALVSNGWVV